MTVLVRSKQSWSDIESALSQTYPEVLAKCQPRLFHAETGYLSSRAVGARLGSMIANMSIDRRDASAYFAGVAASIAMQHEVPVWWLRPELAHELAAQPVRGEAHAGAVPLPDATMVILLPGGFLQTPEGNNCDFVVISRWMHGTKPPTLPLEVEPHLIISTVASKNAVPVETLHAHSPSSCLLEEWFTGKAQMVTHNGAAIVAGDEDFLDVLKQVAINAAFAVAENPGLVTASTVTDRVRSKGAGGDKVDLWSPRWVGATVPPAST